MGLLKSNAGCWPSDGADVTMQFLTLQDISVAGKRVVVREDFNVPMENGKITNDMRIIATLPTIKQLLAQKAAIVLLSHFGRPTEGVYDPENSLEPVAQRLSTLLGQPVRLEKEWLSGVAVAPGEIVLCENVRFEKGEGANDETLGKKMAALGDVFVMDAFGVAHRAQASTHAIAKFAPISCAGPLLAAEVQALTKALAAPQRPLLAIVGGSKVSTKLTVLENLVPLVDRLIVGGGIANTFLAAKGYPVGKSLYEPALVETAKQLIATMEKRGAQIPIPVDVVVAKEFSAAAQAVVRKVEDVAEDEMILDIGPQTSLLYEKIIQEAQTIVWNGPVGVFELAPFAQGTQKLAQAIANSAAFSLAGGGDTLAAVEQFGVEKGISYLSTGGGAFLEFLEGRTLPSIGILETRLSQ